MYKFPILNVRQKRPTIYGRFTIFYAKKNGGPFLKHEKKTWWDINGCMIHTKKLRIVFMFKRRVLKP